MSDFATEAFARLQEQYKAIDVGAAAIYQAAYDLLELDDADAARLILLHATDIFSSADPFIVEGETTHTQVYLEIFRRAFYVRQHWMSPDEHRKVVVQFTTILSNAAHAYG